MKINVRWQGNSGPVGWLARIGVTLVAAAFLVVSLIFFSVFVVVGALVALGGLLYLLWAKPRTEGRDDRIVIEGELAEEVSDDTNRDPALEHRATNQVGRTKRDG